MKKNLSLLLLIIAVSISVLAQTKITGVVTADNGDLLPGATVLLKGTTIGTVTDINGNYSLDVQSNEGTIVFSYVGYITKEISIDGQTNIDVILTMDITGLDEIVVIGYGVQKKSLVTGAISKVTSDEISQTQNLRVEQALQGKTAGVIIAQQSGSPGADITVRVRGIGSNSTSSPLFVVDGMRTSGIDYLSPNDIESIEILKDAASSAIYGAEAANGVVIITTKKGTKGQTSFNYNGYYGIQNVAHYQESMDAEQYIKYHHEAFAWKYIYSRSDPSAYTMESPEVIDAGFKGLPYSYESGTVYKLDWEDGNLRTSDNATTRTNLGTGTDWMAEMFSPAPITSHNLSATGGSDLGSYYISGGFFNQEGIVGGPKSNYDRYNFRFNGNININKWMNVYSNVGYTHKERKSLTENDWFSGQLTAAKHLDPLTPITVSSIEELPEFAQGFKPYLLRNEDGEYYGISDLITATELANPFAKIEDHNGIWKEDKLVGGTGIDFTPIDGLKIHSGVDIDLAYAHNSWSTSPRFYSEENHLETDTLDALNVSGDPLDGTIDSIDNAPSLTYETFKWFTIQNENYITYSFKIGSNNISLLAGNTIRQYSHMRYAVTVPGLYSTDERWKVYGATDWTSSISSDINIYVPWGGLGYETNRLVSYYGRLSYDYNEKYMATVNFRADGSSKFGPNNKFGYFPSISAGWIISRENFFPQMDIISFMKLRASWGINGSLSNLDDWKYLKLYERTTGGLITATGEDNPDLRWEQSKQTDIALDLGFFRNKIMLTADYFIKLTDGLLVQASVPEYLLTRGDQPYINGGIIQNNGLELELRFNDKEGDLKYSIGLNGSFLKNKVKELSKNYAALRGANLQGNIINKFEEGESVWYFWGFETNGVFQNQQEIDDYYVVNTDGDTVRPQADAVPGEIKLIDWASYDINGEVVAKPDGVLDEADRKNLGSPYPKFTYGINANFDYHNFDLTLFIQGVYGNKIYNVERLDQSYLNKAAWLYEDRWTGYGSTNSGVLPVCGSYTAYLTMPNDFWIQDGSYLRLKQIMFGYTLPEALSSKLLIKKLRIYVSGNNLLTLTKYRGSDPELGGTSNDDTNTIGIDYGMYPSAKSIIGGINLTF